MSRWAWFAAGVALGTLASFVVWGLLGEERS
jgi:hypothetical protein